MAVEWLTESIKRYDEYYDQHQIDDVEILEEIAKSFVGNNQIYEAEKIIEKILRMNSRSQIQKLLESSELRRNISSTRNLMRAERFCSPRHFLLHNVFSCSV